MKGRKDIFKDRTGEINYNIYGSKMTLIKYNGAKDIIVEFENGYKTKSAYQYFKKGNIISPYNKTVYNIGYLGKGEYRAIVDKTQTIQHLYWNSMFHRCYSSKYHENKPTYENCSVCEDWHNFQNFGKWFDDNYYQIEGQRIHLDKDILAKGNKIYSPETCVFVPQCINSVFIKHDAKRGEYPIGVSKIKNSFVVRCNDIFNISQYLGSFDTPEDGFNIGYKPYKEKLIKQYAETYKDKIPKVLYDALYKYEVEITD